ncbi:MAG: PAS domain S-box protein, partial [Ignavibacterium sp.]
MSKEENISSSFFANPHFAFYRISSDGYPVFANQTLIRMLGFSSRDEFIKSFKENPQFRENFSISKYQEHLLKINNTDGIESIWRKKNGRIVVVTEYIQKYFDPTDGSVFYDCIAEDITEKKIIDELMSDVIGRDYAIIKALPDILFILSNDGNFTDYKTGNNSGFPISPDYFVGKSLWDVFPQQISDDLYRTIKETRLNGQLSTYDFQMPGQFGSKHYEARVVKSHQNEVLLLLRDVTNQKQNELQILKIAEDLRQIN